MGLCGSSNYDPSLPHTESWTSADSATSDASEDADGNDNNLDDVGTYTEFEQTNLFGMKCDPERVEVLLRNNSQVLLRLTDARNPRGAGHVSCLNQCGPRASDEWVATLADALAANTTLTELHFGSGHHLTETGAAALATVIQTSSSLQKLSLVYGTPGIGAGGTSKIASALPMNSNLEILDLTSNAIGDDGAKALSPALGGMASGASEAAAEQGEAYVSADVDAGGEGADAAAEKGGDVGDESTDDKVAASGESGDGKLITNIAHSPESFRMNATLRSLLLSGNGIGPAGAKSLATMIRNNKSITNLNLTDNMIGDEGSIALGEAITNNTVLHTLGLGNNNIKADGTRALATMLESNQSLQRLMLENNIIHDANHRNCIGDAGTEALANMLENNRTLYFLNLTEAGTTADSVRSLANALEIGNTSIIKLAVHPNLDPKLDRLLSRNMQTHRASQKLKAKLKKMRRR